MLGKIYIGKNSRYIFSLDDFEKYRTDRIKYNQTIKNLGCLKELMDLQ